MKREGKKKKKPRELGGGKQWDSVGGRGVHSCLSDSIKADGAPVKPFTASALVLSQH